MSVRLDALAELQQHILAEAPSKQPFLVALAGPPGAGKSTLAAQLADHLNSARPAIAVVMEMDGFHFDDMILEDRNLLDRKGAPETFDFDGFSAMIARLKDGKGAAIPVFDRELELSRGSARMIEPHTQVVIVEGNYLLLREPPWSTLANSFDMTVWLQVDEVTLAARLTKRWLDRGMSAEAASARVEGNDLKNARRVQQDSVPAHYVFDAAARMPR